MTKKLTKSLFLAAVAVVCLTVSCLTVAAADTYVFPVSVKYGQTEARSMLAMINEFRTGSDAWYWDYDGTKKVLTDLKPLEYDYGLEQIAMQRAAEIAVSFDHTRPDGSDCFSATVGSGYSAMGENIAAGYGYSIVTTVEGAFETWQETDYGYWGQGHRRNMLGDFTHIGIAHVVVNGTHYWVQEFGYSSSGVSRTAADDSSKTVNVNISSDYITSLSVSASTSSLALSVGKTADVPTAAVSIEMYYTWPKPITSTVTPDWKVSGSAVSVSGGKITAKSVGTATLTATVYGETLTVNVTVECTDHKWGSWSTTKAATCTEKGSQTHKCSVCGKSETQDIAAKGHSFGSYTVTKAATCTASGTETRSCSVCSQTETRTIAAKGHSWGAYKTVTAATEDKEGLEERTCSVCSQKEQRTIAKLTSQSSEPANSDETSSDNEISDIEASDIEASDSENSDNEASDSEVFDSETPEQSETPNDSSDISDSPNASSSDSLDSSPSEQEPSDSSADPEQSEPSETSTSSSQTNEGGDNSSMLYIIIAAAAAVLLAVGGIIFAVVRKRK